MHNFKKICLMVLILACMGKILGFLLAPVTYGDYLKHDLKELEKEGKQPDVVLVGDSRIYRSFVPEILDRELDGGGHCSINTGSGSQRMQGSYYYLKDLLEKYPVEYAIVGLTYTAFLEKDSPSAQAEMVVFDRLETMGVKADYIREAVPLEELPYLFKCYRYRGNFSEIPENLKMKLSWETRNGIDTRPGEHYENRGYVCSESGFRDGETGMPVPVPAQWSEGAIDEEAFQWLDRIRELCDEKGVNLILVTGPTTLSTIYFVKEYEKSYETFRDYARRWSLPYFELNLLKKRRTLLPDSMMRDSDHVSGEGAKQISTLFCRILNDYLEGKDIKPYFYASVDEMKQDINEVVACDFHTEEIAGSEDRLWIAESLQQEGRAVEYEFLISEGETQNDWEVLSPYGEKAECVIPQEKLKGPVWLRVNARMKGSMKEWEAFMVRSREPGE